MLKPRLYLTREDERDVESNSRSDTVTILILDQDFTSLVKHVVQQYIARYQKMEFGKMHVVTCAQEMVRNLISLDAMGWVSDMACLGASNPYFSFPPSLQPNSKTGQVFLPVSVLAR